MMTNLAAFLLDSLPYLLFGFPGEPGGLVVSILLAVVAVGLGWLLAVVIGSGYEARSPVIRGVCHVYVITLRGLPLLLLLLLVHQLLGRFRPFGATLPPAISAIVALTLSSSVYQAEIVRSGLRAVPERMVESARLMGSTSQQAYMLVKLRYTMQVMLPAFTGHAISLFKDTSIVLIIGVPDLMTIARISLGSDVTNAPYWVGLYLLVGFLYFCVAFGFSQLARQWERRGPIENLVHAL